jgi:hypothetical protein
VRIGADSVARGMGKRAPVARSLKGIHDDVSPTPNPPKFCGDIPSLFRKTPKVENILKTKGKLAHFSSPKAENLLKIKPVT